MTLLQHRHLRDVTGVHHESLHSVPTGEDRQVARVPHLQQGVLSGVLPTPLRPVSIGLGGGTLMLAGVPFGKRRMVGLMARVQLLVLEQMLFGNLRMIGPVTTVQVSVLTGVSLARRGGDRLLLGHAVPSSSLTDWLVRNVTRAWPTWVDQP
jgi:hypothetical protein